MSQELLPLQLLRSDLSYEPCVLNAAGDRDGMKHTSYGTLHIAGDGNAPWTWHGCVWHGCVVISELGYTALYYQVVFRFVTGALWTCLGCSIDIDGKGYRFTCTEDEVVHGKTRVGTSWGRQHSGQFVPPQDRFSCSSRRGTHLVTRNNGVKPNSHCIDVILLYSSECFRLLYSIETGCFRFRFTHDIMLKMNNVTLRLFLQIS
jgi:hypothetical protein